jgi:hypothetical protein
MHNIQKLRNLLINTDILEKLIEDLSVYISAENVMLVLMDCYDSSWDYEKIKNYYLKSQEHKNNSKIFGIVQFDNSIIPNHNNLITYDECIKSKGEIWYIHKNDNDYFPSIPHAHNYDWHMVLHLGNGNLFQGRTPSGQIKRKQLMAIRNKVKNITLPTLEI